jgi:phospholipid/cholesterol/gamma-HCH transport system substrate-binding protein
LFAAMTPKDVNKLSYELIQVFQGEGGTLEGLLNRTASVTTTLAAHDQLVGDLISNLNQTLTTVGNRSGELSDLIIQFRKFVSGLAKDRGAILGSLNSISDLAVQTSDLVTGIRPGLTKDISELRNVTGNINARRSEVDRALKVLPIKLTKVGRTAIYGSWFNFYLCDFTGRIILPTDNVLGLPSHQDVSYHTDTARCHIG